ncbi:hypothetical protein BKA61DRAFT_80188 [Leptodontidium sp. MPI-SDFR-AT-0119]|nr:hypothetical protein BKA61DRAFT_80188 [Leptodontidium sp. MPI-SDFR-AT-0119]
MPVNYHQKDFGLVQPIGKNLRAMIQLRHKELSPSKRLVGPWHQEPFQGVPKWLYDKAHEEVDQRILEELTGRVYYDVGGFYERYFERKSWTNNAKHIYEQSRTQYAEVAVANGRILHFKLHSVSGS